MMSPYPVSGCTASRGGGLPLPNCAQATPAMVTAAPSNFSQVKLSPSVSQAENPAIGGMRQLNGADRATPRTAFTHPHAIQPRNDERTSAQNIPRHTSSVSFVVSMLRKLPRLTSRIGGAEKSSVYDSTISGP